MIYSLPWPFIDRSARSCQPGAIPTGEAGTDHHAWPNVQRLFRSHNGTCASEAACRASCFEEGQGHRGSLSECAEDQTHSHPVTFGKHLFKRKMRLVEGLTQKGECECD